MSYPEKGNPYKRSWANIPDNSGLVRIVARIAENSVTSAKERHEAAEKYRKALEESQKREIERLLTLPSFSSQERIELANMDYEIFRLDGLTFADMIDSNHAIRTWRREEPFEKEVSFKGEVAAHKYFPDLAHTDGKTFGEQKKIFQKFKKGIEEKMPGVTAKIGSLADFIDLELSHRLRYDRGILDRYFLGGVRTASKNLQGNFMVVNTSFMKRLELNMSYLGADASSEFVGLGVIIVPKGSNWKPRQ